jgi:chaperone BCS1
MPVPCPGTLIPTDVNSPNGGTITSVDDTPQKSIRIDQNHTEMKLASAAAKAKADATAPLPRVHTSTIPFDTAFVSNRLGNLAEWEWATVSDSSKLYNLLLTWGVDASGRSQSVALSVQDAKTGATREEMVAQMTSQAKRPSTTAEHLGLGWHGPYGQEHADVYFMHQRVGDPVGTDCGPKVLQELILFSHPPPSGQQSTITTLCDRLLSLDTEQPTGQFNVFRWHAKFKYWKKDKACLARTVDSVVLPPAVKSRLMDDVLDFTSIETLHWFIKHGIPYKRSYLFFGPPGTGKTSMIQALAGEIGRSICYLSPSHPDMTDDSLKSAVQETPKNAIIVLEDIDSLFGVNRAKSADASQSAITFSGMLNALDGVGMPLGQIFIMTTNHRERLDPALIRSGRVDVHLEFPSASREQMRTLFLNFYPEANGEADAFVEQLSAALEPERAEISMSSLQAFFIRNRKSTSKEAAASTEMILQDLEDRKATEAELKREREERAATAAVKAAKKAAAADSDVE